MMKPLLRWAGSKRKLLPVIGSLLPKEFDRYIEPFAGSACLFFMLSPKRAVLGDINAELINVYRQVRGEPKKVAAALGKFPNRSDRTFYMVRSRNPERLTNINRAARFIFLNRLCFNGLYRTNAEGRFNVPYGAKKSGGLPTTAALEAASKLLRAASLKCASFEIILSHAEVDDFVYLDPPYSISNRRVFNNYSADVFSLENLKSLRSELLRLDKKGVRFLLSYGLSREGLDLAKGFKTNHALVQRQISGFSDDRRKARELLITNY